MLKTQKMNGWGPSTPKARKIIGLGKKPSVSFLCKNSGVEQEEGDGV